MLQTVLARSLVKLWRRFDGNISSNSSRKKLSKLARPTPVVLKLRPSPLRIGPFVKDHPTWSKDSYLPQTGEWAIWPPITAVCVQTPFCPYQTQEEIISSEGFCSSQGPWVHPNVFFSMSLSMAQGFQLWRGSTKGRTELQKKENQPEKQKASPSDFGCTFSNDTVNCPFSWSQSLLWK